MGTRYRIEFDKDGVVCASIYGQWDGYVAGAGHELARILEGGQYVNGISSREAKQFNGMYDLAAQALWWLKCNDNGAGPTTGSVYLRPPMAKDGECGEEFIYRVSDVNDKIVVRVESGDVTAFGNPNDPSSFKTIFTGDADAFVAWVRKEMANAD